MKVVGVVLIVVGILALAYGGISWTQRETVADVGPIEIQRTDRETLPLPPLAGAAAIAAGLIVIFMSRKRAAAV
jgi:hypothetical protein